MADGEIRRATVDDAAALAALAERTFRDAFGAANRREDMEIFLAAAYGVGRQAREIAEPAVDTLLATIDEVLVGFAQLRGGEPPEGVAGARPVELWRIYVDRPWHGRGVAVDLLGAVLEAARRRDADVLWLGVWEHNPRAQAFYRKHGFVDVGSHDFMLGHDRQTDRLMARRL